MKVLLIATGGTIASRPGPDGAVAIALRGAEVLARAGVDPATVDVLDAAHGPSWAFAPSAVDTIVDTVLTGARSGEHAGVVVTHGTDTLEETAFLTWLLGGSVPVVFTGAMRHDADPQADGPVNVREAVALAAAGVDGPVVRMAGATHHARWVTKTDTSAVDSFRSVGGDGTPPGPPPPSSAEIDWAVAQVPAHTGVDDGVIAWHLDRGAHGLVVEGTGAGNVHASLVPGIEAAIAAGVPVVVTSRCPTGSVSPTYGGPGGGHHLAELGCIPAGALPTHKARVALAVALGHDPGPDAVRAWFARL